MRQQKALLSILVGILVMFILFLAVYIVISNQLANSSTQEYSVSYPASYSDSVSSTISNSNYKVILNYVSGGSDFYCPNNPKICEKIKLYYLNISQKDFQSAYEYGGSIRSYDSLVSTYKDYKIVSASYIKEHEVNLFTAYVTLITELNEIEMYEVLINADVNSIYSSSPTRLENNLNLDCDYVDLSNRDVCVFKFSNGEIANLYADNFFYKPQFYKGINLDESETVFYSHGTDALDKWVIMYKYNSKSKVLTFVDNIHHKAYPDVEGLCTGDTNIDLSEGGCAEQYLSKEQIESNKVFLAATLMYGINL